MTERCWAHALGCDWTDCPASDTMIGHSCGRAGTGRLGLCPAHDLQIFGSKV